MTHRIINKKRTLATEVVNSMGAVQSRRGMMTGGEPEQGDVIEDGEEHQVEPREVTVREIRKLVREELINAASVGLKPSDGGTMTKKFPKFVEYIRTRPSGDRLDLVKFAIKSGGFLSKGTAYAMLPNSERTVIVWQDGTPKYNASESLAQAIEQLK